MMKRFEQLRLGVLGTLCLILAGCSNPADNVPEAKTTAPQSANASAEEPTAAPTPVEGRVFKFTPESKIEFIGSKVTGSHHGGFKVFQGHLVVANGEVQPGVPIEVDMNSLWTDNERLTRHLRSPDFFDVAQYPKAVFKPTAIEKEGDAHKVTGDLTLHGVTKSITFPAKIAVQDDTVTVQAEFFINRFDFDIRYPGRANDLIRKEVVIKLDLTVKAES